MKKRIILIACLLVCGILLCACSNMNWGFGSYNFTHVHFATPDGNGYCAAVSSWHDNDVGCEVHFTNGGTAYLSEGSYILFDSAIACPYCN